MLVKHSSVAAIDADDTSITRDAEYFEYTSSANPIGARLIPRVPHRSFPASLYDSGPTRIVELDLSAELGCDYPATGPGLLANFVRIVAGESVSFDPNATSQVFYVLEGEGVVRQAHACFPFGRGDFFALPGGAQTVIEAGATARLYAVNDGPLLSYLGVSFDRPRFSATRYPAATARAELDRVVNAPGAQRRNRVSVLLGNRRFPQTRTVTHSMWAMFGMIAPGSVQKPHRHQSIALDFIPACRPGVYTLVGQEIDGDGNIVDPVRIDWQPGMAFVTPPGLWHAHVNESDDVAYVVPLQDAGLQTYLRSLDIRFAR